MKKLILLLVLTLSFFSSLSFAKPLLIAPQPSSCIQAAFSNSGSAYWKMINLQLTNNCGQPVDFQNVAVTFLNASNLNTNFWGQFGTLSYPDNTLQITSQAQPAGNFLSTFSLHFPSYSGSNSVLPNGKSITITYGEASADYVANSVNVYLGTPVNTGEIDLTNSSTQPANVTQTYALVHLTFNGQPISDVQVPWSNTLKIPNLAAGTYTIAPASATGSDGSTYQGTANPATINLTAGQTTIAKIAYTLIQPSGSIAFNLPALPTQLAGYTQTPSVVISSTNGATNAMIPWNKTTTIATLVNGTSYTFSSPTISYNGYNCVPSFTPATAIASTTAPIVGIAYTCTLIPLDTVTINVSGAPTSTASVSVTLTANNNTTPLTQTINLTNGQGSATMQLTDGTIYSVSSTAINGLTATYSPQPLTAKANAIETINYSQTITGPGRMIGYVAGWETPPSAMSLSTAGYTHVLVAFGVFNTTTPGQITPAFDTVSLSYIQSLQNLGIKVLLSLGGASTDLANTTVSFDQVLQKATSQAAFVQTFVQSLESLITQYGFDGFDFDIESGLKAGGTFSSPQGDIAALASIINTMHANHPSLLLTLAPQTANMSANAGFSDIWGNYASLIMQTYNSLEWVGVQIYNSGCMYGLNKVCYDPNNTASPDFSVAMAADLLENWSTALGFQPYLSNLKPSQVVLGYLMPNAQGSGDGTPVYPVATIKRALQCLRTGIASATSCDTYIPPHTYQGIGGVFGWETTFDQSNNFQFATGLSSCLATGSC